MPYIDTEHLFKCETCRFYRNGKCNSYCDAVESYSPNLEKIPTADVVPRDEVIKIFEEIEQELVAAFEDNHRVRDELLAKKNIPYEMVACTDGKLNALRGIEEFIEKLKEKYTKGGEGE